MGCIRRRMLITTEYIELNKQLHGSCPTYGTTGNKWAARVIAIAADRGTKDVLDYGCGKSTLASSLPFPISQYDPGIPEHSDIPQPADIVVCTDVLEHIEPACLDAVLADIRRLMKVAGVISISTHRASKELPDGRNAHLIQKPGDWWLDKLKTLFIVDSVIENHGRLVSVLVS